MLDNHNVRHFDVNGKAALWLKPVPEELHQLAHEVLDEGDVDSFLFTAPNTYSLDLAWHNREELKRRELYERALLSAFIGTRTNNKCWPLDMLHYMFKLADRDRLRAAGEALPHAGPFTLYRGVAGKGAARRVRGLSWTSSLERARWFADRISDHLADPAVFTITVNEADVLAYTNEREEQEFIVSVPDIMKPERLP